MTTAVAEGGDGRPSNGRDRHSRFGAGGGELRWYRAGTGKTRTASALLGVALAASAPAASAAPEAQAGSASADGDQPISASELNKQLNNPVSSIWSITIQNNFTSLENDSGTDVPGWEDGENKWLYNMNFQPVLPIKLTGSWNLISRPVIPIFADRQVFDGGGFKGRSGLGDITLFSLLSPEASGDGFLWGVGPSLIFPTASRNDLGQEKWQAGPAAVALYLSKDWVFGVLPQHWWSYAGNGDRPSTSTSNVQYFIQRLLPNQWQIGMAPNIVIDWEEDTDNAVTFPVGLGVGKLLRFGKLPVKLQLEVQYAVVHPDDFGQRWNVRFVVNPVLPALVKKPVFGED
jgi:hypothetical protein